VFRTARGDLVAAGMLSAVAGYVDAAGFLGLFGLFTAHVTGDLVAVGTTFADGVRSGLGLRLATIVVFVTSVSTAALVANAMRRRGYQPLPALFALMTLALTLFCATGIMLQSQLHGPDAWPVVLTGAIGVFAMGIQNALMRDVLSSLGPTTLMTGHLAQVTLDLVAAALPDDERSSRGDRAVNRLDARRRLARSATSVLAFLVGTVSGGAATTVFGFWSIALPAAMMGTLTFSAWSHSRPPERRARRLRLARQFPSARSDRLAWR
jgi:uncharacterized membrane protein YoaK (UPF0700 family)